MPENLKPQDEPATDRRRRTIGTNSSVIITSGGQSWTTRITVDDVDVTNAVRGFQLRQRARELPTLVLDLAIVPTVEAPTVAQSAMTEVSMPDETAALLCRAGWTPPGPADQPDEAEPRDLREAAERVLRYVRGSGIDRYSVTTDDGEPAPLYARDLEALCRAALHQGQDRAADNERTLDEYDRIRRDYRVSTHSLVTIASGGQSWTTRVAVDPESLARDLEVICRAIRDLRDLERARDEALAKVQRLRAMVEPVEDAQHPAYVLNVTEDDGYLYLECGECDDMVTGIEDGDALTDLLARAREHHETHHQSEAASDAWDMLDQAMTPIVAGELARQDSGKVSLGIDSAVASWTNAAMGDGEPESPDGPLYELTVATRGPGGEAKVLVSYGDGRLVLTCQECGHLADVEDGPGALPPLVADALDHQRTSHNHTKEAS